MVRPGVVSGARGWLTAAPFSGLPTRRTAGQLSKQVPPPLVMQAGGGKAEKMVQNTRGSALIVGWRVSELLHGLLDPKGSGFLAWRKLLEAQQMLGHERLRRDEHEGVLDKPPHVITRLVL